MLLKCKQCNSIEDESTIAFYNRTKKKYDSPFFCKFCTRIMKFNNDPILAEKKNKDHQEKLSDKRELREFIRKVNKDDYINLKIKENIELLRKKNLEYRKTESGKNSIKNAYIKRQKQILESLINMDEKEHANIKKFYQKKPIGYEVDHIIPISKGGKHCISNLQYLTPNENKQKSNKIDKFLIQSLCDGQRVSTCILMRKFKMTFEEAKKIIDEVWFESDATN